MSNSKDYSINFTHQGTNYDLNLVKGITSDHTVEINGLSYAILGDKEKLDKATEILRSVSLDAVSSLEELKGKISLRGDISFPQAQKADAVGIHTLGTRQAFRAWRADEEETLPKMKHDVALLFWKGRKNPKSLEGLRGFIGEKQFDEAIQSKDFAKFLALFDDLSVDELWKVRNTENRQPLGFVKTEPYEITQEDIANLKHYLDDVGFSGAVSLSDAKRTYTITPTNKETLQNVSFSINSISKIFTGILALMTLSPDEIKDKIHLSPETLAYLKTEKAEVYRHLEHPSLLQTMNHDGGFGDFLGNYERAVVDAIEKGEDPPAINRPEDFLKYADTTLYPLNSGRYSNLGILLVGLAVQHKCKETPYDQLLEELILAPAKMQVSNLKPEGGKFSERDPCQGMLAGGPSGGHWTTSEELLKLGTWLLGKCTPPKKEGETEESRKTEFLSKLELYGTEFYVPEDREIRHNGCSYAGSSFLSSFLDSGITVSVLSDQGDFMANRIYYAIRKNMIEKEDQPG